MFLSSQGHSRSIPTHLHAFQLHLTPINSTPTFARAGQWSADAFSDAYVAATKHYRTPEGWYHESNMDTGAPTHLQATSLQAFWPGLQVLNGDVRAAKKTHARLWSVWRKYEMFPERYQYVDGTLHASERYYPLRRVQRAVDVLIPLREHLVLSPHAPQPRVRLFRGSNVAV